MILIADSGSSKTDWRFVDEEKKIHQFKTSGVNPYFQAIDVISESLTRELLPGLPASIFNNSLEIFFYGAGCSSEEKCKVVASALKKNFPESEINIYHDLLGAARSLCGHEEGIAAILGTGSNSCYFDGKKIVENNASLGFILGDEGSGAYLGKLFMSQYFYNEVPEDLVALFKGKFSVSKEAFLEAIYNKPNPNRYLATFAPFLQQHVAHSFVSRLIYGAFNDFFDHHISKYSNHKNAKMHCVGSIGYYFGNILRQVASDRGVALQKIMISPIAGLTLYHLGE